MSEGDWKLEKTIEVLNYGGLRPCLCIPCGWPDDGSFSSNLPVSHTNYVLSRISSTQTTFLNNHVISGNHQSPPPSHDAILEGTIMASSRVPGTDTCIVRCDPGAATLGMDLETKD